MHSLLPDKVDVRDAVTGKVKSTVGLGDIILKNGTKVNTSMSLQDLFYSLGSGHAGGWLNDCQYL